MKKIVTGAALLVGAAAVLHRFGPALGERAMNKCHEMMTRQGSGCAPMDKAA